MVGFTLAALTTLLTAASSVRAQVTATFPNGATNPPAPFIAEPGTAINQTSMARLLTLNGVDDFCLFGPPESGPESLIGNVEPIVVAYCLKVRTRRAVPRSSRWQSADFPSSSFVVHCRI
jgi:hypothetical protein